MKFVIYIHREPTGGPVAWEVWVANGHDDKKMGSGVGFDFTQAMLHAGEVMARG